MVREGIKNQINEEKRKMKKILVKKKKKTKDKIC
jgi:hypothetical protein